ncbi:TPA: phosphomannomutase/phosphoglucomutase [Candidatus Micrarchaeota archaeon]|nr:MAG: hypothetical protein AUJ65_00300 [Candidatus Micrarchaeota archaeon CG1_02_51_15]HII39493.1 phosphomannomutase/phosphoglucomutase [Candidatus Micrarchaeota archaeon]
MNSHIFREYDIRGVFGKDFTEQDAELIGRAAASHLKRLGAKNMVVGRDCRVSSPALRKAIVRGIVSAGVDVIDVGMVPTPEYCFAVGYLKSGGGIMITASHNPPEFNGFKINFAGFTGSFTGPEVRELHKIIVGSAFESGVGKEEERNVDEDYLLRLLKDITTDVKLKLVVDAGNGVAGEMTCRVLRKLGHDVISIHCEPDGTFPNHEPNPESVSTLRDLIAEVRRSGADAGIALDGDGDRIGLVDERGEVVLIDRLLALFARVVLEKNPGAKVVFEIKCSQALSEDIVAHGGIPLLNRTGHSFIQKRMAEENALLGGEVSGHVFFRDRAEGVDDGIYAACRLAEILSCTSKTLSQLFSDLPKYVSTEEILVDCPDEVKFGVIERFTKKMKESGKEVVDVDGCRVHYVDGWGLARVSNTRPVVSTRFEGKTREALERIYAEFTRELAIEGIKLPDLNEVHVTN